MLKLRHTIIITTLPLIAVLACHRLPLYLGEGVDDALSDPDDPTGRGGATSAGGATALGGAGSDPTTGLDECETTYVSCLESGGLPDTCRGILVRCQGASAIGGAGGLDPATGLAGRGGEPSAGGGYPAAGGHDGGPIAGGGYPAAGGYGGDPATGLDECNTTYVLCLESGEDVEICRAELSRCEGSPIGAGGASGEGGAGG